MKKVLSLLGIVGMALVLTVGSAGVFTQAASNSGNDAEVMQQSRVIFHGTGYPGNIIPPSTYPYDDGVWSGTLYLYDYQFDGTMTRAVYRGTVYCSGNCPIPPNTDNN